MSSGVTCTHLHHHHGTSSFLINQHAHHTYVCPSDVCVCVASKVAKPDFAASHD